MSVTLGWPSALFVWCGRIEIKFWRWRHWYMLLAGVWSQAVGFLFGVFGRNVASIVVKMFSYLICV
jgi:hypothetical protein